MTTENSPMHDEEIPVEQAQLNLSQDWFLEDIINVFVSKGLGMGVTLTVGGVIVSGLLISGKKYFQQLSENIQTGSDASGEIGEIIGGHWKGYTAIYEKPDNAPDDWEPRPVGYVHLANAQIHAPGQSPIPTNQGVLWRGKLSSVDSFFIGQMQQD
ncbi:MAG: gas vesicle accessory protein GvpU [Yoonia sp.]